MRNMRLPEWLQIGIAIIGVWVGYSQLDQLNEEQRWKNYSELNARYADFYQALPREVLVAATDNFVKATPETKRVIRQYFDLYSEEFWLYKEGRIPESMWTQRINNGVAINLAEYPALISGYRYWKTKGAFQHPADFRVEVEKLIAEVCRNQPKLEPCRLPL